MDDFSIKPGEQNFYGVVGGSANEIAPGKRMLSSMTPTILLQDGKVHMVIGTPGGSTIFTSVFQGIVNVEGKPVVVQGVQHLFHPPVELDRWPSDDHESRLVFITRHIEADVIRRLFDVVGQLGQGTPPSVATAS